MAIIAVCGPGDPDAGPRALADAEAAGRVIAEAGATLVCGGLGGVMEAACRGAAQAGGVTVGLLPGEDPRAANRWVSVPLATGLGELRNGLIVRVAQAVVAIHGGWGTLSEVAFARKIGRPVVAVGDWGELHELERAADGATAAERALELARDTAPSA
jgi:uncharacterized protein (TIGR00725 family)